MSTPLHVGAPPRHTVSRAYVLPAKRQVRFPSTRAGVFITIKVIISPYQIRDIILGCTGGSANSSTLPRQLRCAASVRRIKTFVPSLLEPTAVQISGTRNTVFHALKVSPVHIPITRAGSSCIRAAAAVETVVGIPAKVPLTAIRRCGPHP